jgi:hypothetical protein
MSFSNYDSLEHGCGKTWAYKAQNPPCARVSVVKSNAANNFPTGALILARSSLHLRAQKVPPFSETFWVTDATGGKMRPPTDSH